MFVNYKLVVVCFLFLSGFVVNLVMIMVFVGLEDFIFCDWFVYVSLIDGCCLSGVLICFFCYNDVRYLSDFFV